ncbi:MAG: hypothetical protein ACFFDW_02775 [Candidatus Thorarchaeota archaeon]
MSVKKMRLELLVASPPTKKCKNLIEIFEGFIANSSDLKLDIYYAGTPPTVNTTKGFKTNIDKRVKIPIGFINGNQVPKELLFEEKELATIIQQQRDLGSEKWDE